MFCRPAVETLEERASPTWIGAMSGVTNDAAHTYNTTTNWAGGVIDDSFAGVNFTAATTLYLSANRTTGASGLNLNYVGSSDLTFLSSAANSLRTLSLTGNVTGDFGGASAQTVTIGSIANLVNVDLNGATRTFDVTGAGDNLVLANVLTNSTGVAGLSKTGLGTLTLSGENAYNGGTTINAGTVSIAGDASLGTVPAVVDPANIAINGGTVSASTSFTLNPNRGMMLGAAGGALDVAAGQLLKYGGIIAGAGGLTKTGSGVLNLSGTNTYAGPTNVNGGTLQLGAPPVATVPAGFAAYYSFDSFSGTTVNNGGSAGSAKNATLSNGASISVGAGLNGSNAMSIAPTGTQVLTITTSGSPVKGIDLSAAAAPAGWTASAWFKGLYTQAATGTWRTLFRGASADHFLIVNQAAGATDIGMFDNAGGTNFHSSGYSVKAGGIENSTDWHQLTAVGQGGSTFIYVDGQLAAVSTFQSRADIGAVGASIGGSQPFAALIDEVYIYQNPLSNQQVLDLYNATRFNVAPPAPGTTNIIPDLSAVSVAAGATFDLNSNTETIGSIAGAGSVTLGSGTLITGGNNGSTTFSGTVSGTGGLSKIGNGSLLLNAANPLTGLTTVVSGTLGGIGSVAGGVTVGTATLDPGVTTGTFTVGGNLKLGGTSTLAVQLAGTSAYDQVSVKGSANLGGAALNLTPQFTPPSNSQFVIVSAAGGVSGLLTFGGTALVDGSRFTVGGITFQINYTPTTVVLTVPPPPPPPPAAIYVATGSDAGGLSTVNVMNARTGTPAFILLPFGQFFTGGARVAVGDVNGDGTPDIIAGAGPGGGPQVAVFDGKTGGLLYTFFALTGANGSFGFGLSAVVPSITSGGFSSVFGFTGGLYVAAGDVNGDGAADIIVGADRGGGPQVQVFDGRTGTLLRNFFAFAPFFKGGVRVAAGDVNGDGKADIICAAGAGGGPQVTVFDGATGGVLQNFYAFAPFFTGGVYVAAGDINGDKRADIITGAGAGAGPQVTAFDGTTLTVLDNFFAYPIYFTGGVRVGAKDVNGDGRADIVVGPGRGGLPQVSVFDSQTLALLESFFAFPNGTNNGVFVN